MSSTPKARLGADTVMVQPNGHGHPSFMHLMTQVRMHARMHRASRRILTQRHDRPAAFPLQVDSPELISVVHYAGEFRSTTVLLDTHALQSTITVQCTPPPVAGGCASVTISAFAGALPFTVAVGTTLLGSVAHFDTNCSGVTADPGSVWPIMAVVDSVLALSNASATVCVTAEPNFLAHAWPLSTASYFRGHPVDWFRALAVGNSSLDVTPFKSQAPGGSGSGGGRRSLAASSACGMGHRLLHVRIPGSVRHWLFPARLELQQSGHHSGHQHVQRGRRQPRAVRVRAADQDAGGHLQRGRHRRRGRLPHRGWLVVPQRRLQRSRDVYVRLPGRLSQWLYQRPWRVHGHYAVHVPQRRLERGGHGTPAVAARSVTHERLTLRWPRQCTSVYNAACPGATWPTFCASKRVPNASAFRRLHQYRWGLHGHRGRRHVFQRWH